MKDKDFTYIEEYFSQKRGSPTLLSPRDWELIDQWRKMGIPLKVILQGIDQSFIKFKKANKKGVKINSISYCQQEVLAAWEEYKELTVGKSPEENKRKYSTPLWQKKLEKKLLSLAKSVNKSALKAEKRGKKSLGQKLREGGEKLQRLSQLLNREEIDIPSCHHQLNTLDREISAALLASATSQEIDKANAIAEQELLEYKERMKHNIYQQIKDNFVRQFLQQQYGIPRISLYI